jgi:hypothetical protein
VGPQDLYGLFDSSYQKKSASIRRKSGGNLKGTLLVHLEKIFMNRTGAVNKKKNDNYAGKEILTRIF